VLSSGLTASKWLTARVCFLGVVLVRQAWRFCAKPHATLVVGDERLTASAAIVVAHQSSTSASRSLVGYAWTERSHSWQSEIRQQYSVALCL
jgi:hypothetical protein